MNPGEFWRLTYAEFREIISGYKRKMVRRRNELMFVAWHTAALSRQNRLPEFKSLIQDEDEQPEEIEMTDDEIMNRCKLLNAALGGRFIEVTDEQVKDNQN